MAAALATSWLLGGAPAHAQVTSEPSAVVFPDPAKFAHGFYTEGEFGAVGSSGAPATSLAGLRGRRARRLRHLPLLRGAGSPARARPTRSQGDTPIAGQLLQIYQGTVEGKLTLRLVQSSFFAEGGLGAARMSTNLLYARGSAQYRTGFTAGRRRRHRLPLPVAPLLGRPAGRLLRAARRHQQPGRVDDHVPEVHVLMRALRCSAIALPRPSSRVGCETVDLGAAARRRQRLPAQPAVLRRRDLAQRSWPRTYRTACTATTRPATARWRRTR